MGVVVVAFCRISGFAGGCVRIGSHSDGSAYGFGWLGGVWASLCEDLLAQRLPGQRETSVMAD